MSSVNESSGLAEKVFPTITIYDRIVLAKFIGHLDFFKQIQSTGYGCSVEILDKEKIISLIINGKCLESKDYTTLPGTGSPLLRFAYHVQTNCVEQIAERIIELVPKKRKAKQSTVSSKSPKTAPIKQEQKEEEEE